MSGMTETRCGCGLRNCVSTIPLVNCIACKGTGKSRRNPGRRCGHCLGKKRHHDWPKPPVGIDGGTF